MSADYASRLSDYKNKGKCGQPEKFDSLDKLEEKVSLLHSMVVSAKHIVVYTGAGISTAAGIPDFRGPKGVWTLEKQGRKIETSITFEDARPTRTHLALTALVERRIVHQVISQNVDGLHLKAGLPRESLCELHGNMFMEICEKCGRYIICNYLYVRVGFKWKVY